MLLIQILQFFCDYINPIVHCNLNSLHKSSQYPKSDLDSKSSIWKEEGHVLRKKNVVTLALKRQGEACKNKVHAGKTTRYVPTRRV